MKRCAAGFLLLGLACSGSQEETPVPTQAVPIAVGNYWIYQETDTVGQVDTLDTTVVLGDTLYQSHTAYVVAGYLMGTYDTAVFYYADSFLNAVYDMDLMGIIMPVDGKLMPEFLDVGQHWQVFQGETTGIYLPPVFDSTDVVKLSIWATVEDSGTRSVPAGSFDPVYTIHYDDTIYKNGGYMLSVWQYSWVAPGTGIIQRDDDSLGQDPTAELVDYHLNQQ